MKIYISLSDLKILTAVYKIFNKGVKTIDKNKILDEYGINRRVLNRNIKNSYKKENLLNQIIKD